MDVVLPAPWPDMQLRAWAELWLRERKRAAIASVKDDRARLEHHVLPRRTEAPLGMFDGLGEPWADREVEAIDRRDVRELVRQLDHEVRAGRLGWKTAQNVWNLVRGLFRAAQTSKDDALRVRLDNPTDGVAGPDRGPKKVKVFLWPDEVFRLLATSAVPLRYRELYAAKSYMGFRCGEVEELRVGDVDVAHRSVHVHRARDRIRKGPVTHLKGRSARRIPIEAAILPLFVELVRGRAAGELLLPMPSRGRLSERLRRHCRRAGIDRADLYTTDATTRALTIHDLRATTATWMVMRGDSPWDVARRLGHKHLATTELYVREAPIGPFPTEGPERPFPELPYEFLREVRAARGRDTEVDEVVRRAGRAPAARSKPTASVELTGIEPVTFAPFLPRNPPSRSATKPAKKRKPCRHCGAPTFRVGAADVCIGCGKWRWSSRVGGHGKRTTR